MSWDLCYRRASDTLLREWFCSGEVIHRKYMYGSVALLPFSLLLGVSRQTFRWVFSPPLWAFLNCRQSAACSFLRTTIYVENLTLERWNACADSSTPEFRFGMESISCLFPLAGASGTILSVRSQFPLCFCTFHWLAVWFVAGPSVLNYHSPQMLPRTLTSYVNADLVRILFLLAVLFLIDW